MSKGIPQEVADAMSASRKPLSSPQMKTEIEAKCREAKASQLRIAELETMLAEEKARLKDLCETVIPELMHSAGLDKAGVAAEGNLPAFDVKLSPEYRASIPVAWPEEKRRAAFDWLSSHGHGSLIKTEVSVSFDREDRETAVAFIDELKEQGQSFDVSEQVHFKTLGSWLKETHQSKGELPPLDLIGGAIVTKATIKDRKP